MHCLGQQPEFFFVHAPFCVRADKETKPHDSAGQSTTGTAGLTHAAAEAGSKLFGLLSRQPAFKTMIENKQKRLRTAQPTVFIEIFSSLPDECNDFRMPDFITPIRTHWKTV
jgi:hypothetical protein